MSPDDDALNTRRRSTEVGHAASSAPAITRLPGKYWTVEYNLPPGFVRHPREDGHDYFWTRDFRVGYSDSPIQLSIKVEPEIHKNRILITVIDVEHAGNVINRSKVYMISKTSDWRQRLAQRLGLLIVKTNNKRKNENERPTSLAPEYDNIADALLPGCRFTEGTKISPAYWTLHPNRSSNLTVKICPDLHRKIITIKVFYQQPAKTEDEVIETNPSQPAGEVLEITKWTHEISMTGGDSRWKTSLAERLGEASVQAKKQPKCPRCKRPPVLRDSIHGQFFGCVDFPKCTATLSIGEFQTELPQVYFDQQAHKTSQQARAA